MAFPSLFPTGPERVGLIVRYKAARSAPCSDGFGHVDAILPSGEPMGFYSKTFDLTAIVSADGEVKDYALTAASRPQYVSIKDARAKRCPSVALSIPVTRKQADTVTAEWARYRTSAMTYRAAGGNCATYIAEAWETAGIIKGGIPGLDTPDNLFEFVDGLFPKADFAMGYFGFRPLGPLFVVEYEL